MQVKIENDRVHQNVLIFLKLASLMKKERRREQLQDRTHTAFINRINGEIYFLELLSTPHFLHEKDWKKIALCCQTDPIDHHLNIEVQEAESGRSFECEELTPLALRVMVETVKTLNQMTRLAKQQALDELDIQSFGIDLIQATWHEADRPQAESILEKHPYGSYLFRCDEYASLLGKLLRRELKRSLQVYTLSFIESQKKFSDLTVIEDQGKWLIYNDDPNLSGKAYDSLPALLEELKDKCQIPVFH